MKFMLVLAKLQNGKDARGENRNLDLNYILTKSSMWMWMWLWLWLCLRIFPLAERVYF